MGGPLADIRRVRVEDAAAVTDGALSARTVVDGFAGEELVDRFEEPSGRRIHVEPEVRLDVDRPDARGLAVGQRDRLLSPVRRHVQLADGRDRAVEVDRVALAVAVS